MPWCASYQPSRFCWTITPVVYAPTKWCSTRSYSTWLSLQTDYAIRPRPLAPPQSRHPHRFKSSRPRDRGLLGVSQCRDTRYATAVARSLMCGGKGKETGEEAPRAVGEPASCLKIVKICVIMYVHLNAYMCVKELFPPHSVITMPLAPPQSGTEPLPTHVIAV